MDNIIEFKDFKIDKSTRKIYKHNKQVSIQKKPYELLLYLIEHRDRAVAKDELINKVWNGSIVTDSTLSHAIFKLRASLRDNKGKEDIIRTARGFGFQFIAELNQQASPQNTTKTSHHLPEQSRRKHHLIYAITLVLLIVVGITMIKFSTPNDKLNRPNNVVIKNLSDNYQSRSIGFIANSDEANLDDWLFQSTTVYLNQLMAYSENSNSELLLLMNNITDKNRTLQIKDSDKITAKYGNNNLSLSFHATQQQIQLPFDNIPETVSVINVWLCDQVFNNTSDCQKTLNELTTQNSFLLENYLRGIHLYNTNDYDKAINYFNICLQEDSSFRLARFAIAQSYFALSQYQKSIAQLQTLVTTTDNKRLISQALILLGKNYFRLSEYDQSEKAFTKVINKHSDESSLKAYALIESAQISQERSNLDQAFNLASKGNMILKKANLPRLLARSYKILGSIKNAQGNLDEAEKFLIQALNLYEDTNEVSGIVSVLSQIGSVFQAKGDLSTSLAYAERRQVLVERLGDPIEIAGSHLQLAYLLLQIGSLDKASFHANTMWEIAAKEQEPRAQMMASLIMGEISNAKNNTQLALDHYSRALKFSRELGLIRREVTMLCNMGKVAIDGELFKQAQESLLLCKETADKAEYTLFKSVARLYLGELFRKIKQQYKSENQLAEALTIANTLNNDDIKKGIHLEYFSLYKSLDVDKAEYHLQLVPDNYQQNYIYLIAKSELEFIKKNFQEAYKFIVEAQQKSGDNWSAEDQQLYEAIKNNI